MFVPLCGKSLDLRHLASLGHEVVGVELSPIAVRRSSIDSGAAPRPNGATLPCSVGGGRRLYSRRLLPRVRRGAVAPLSRACSTGCPDRAASAAAACSVEHLLATVPRGS